MSELKQIIAILPLLDFLELETLSEHIYELKWNMKQDGKRTIKEILDNKE